MTVVKRQCPGDMMFEEFSVNGKMIALIVKNSYCSPGANFFTKPHLSQQLAYMHHPAGRVIVPHIHNRVAREVHYTQEVLFIKRGKLRVDFYDEEKYLESRILEAGDVILLAGGGHGFEVLEELEMFEVKQGPYAGYGDKNLFEPVPPDRVTVKEP